MSTVSSLTQQIAALDISKKAPTSSSSFTAKPTLFKQPSQPNVGKLLTKYAAPNPIPNSGSQSQPTFTKLKPSASQSSLRNPTQANNETTTNANARNPSPAEGSTKPLDIGPYDGGLETDAGRRDKKIPRTSERELALDSSYST